jgi:CubicO group peptidase (beta-lactamase class C family)
MSKGLRTGGWALACALALALAPTALSSQSATAVDSKVDAVFAKYSLSTPGCAVGVSTGGTPVLARGYGMADLEHDVTIAPDTIFEAGSVSKQFTAAAVMLLARDGKLSLDDEVRRYIPELPDYARPHDDGTTPRSGDAAPHAAKAGGGLTIRHMLNHTSGLRDWGSVAAIAGWPRGTRVHTHAHVLEIVSRQRALNFEPGTRWSYSNTGFNLAAVIVERVGGRSFQAFTHDRLFQPLGMTHTSWRDDYTRIVKGRALAYDERNGAFRTDMPFENIYGNGGLLTTVGDLLKWNAHYDAPPHGDAAMVAEQQKPGHFNDGRAHGYGLGLFLGSYKGLREVNHSGSTAGYSAFLTRFPDQRVSVAVLCNVGMDATQVAHQVSDLYLAGQIKASEPAATHSLTSAELARFAGLYRSDTTGVALTIAAGKDGPQASRFGRLFPQSGMRLLDAGNGTWELDARGVRHTDEFGTVDEYARAATWTPEAGELQPYAGAYVSDEAETTLTAAVVDGKLVLKRRPDTTVTLTPIYAGAFSADHGLGTVIFRHDGSGRPTELSVVQDRVWNLRFLRSR